MYCKPIYKVNHPTLPGGALLKVPHTNFWCGVVKWKTQVRRRKFHVKAKIIDELIKKEEVF